MKKQIAIIVLVFLPVFVLSQTIDLNMAPETDTVLTPTEKCLLACIKQLPLGKYLGTKNIHFFDSLINCSIKRIVSVAERRGYYYTTVHFYFTDNLHIRFYPEELKYGNKDLYTKKSSTGTYF